MPFFADTFWRLRGILPRLAEKARSTCTSRLIVRIAGTVLSIGALQAAFLRRKPSRRIVGASGAVELTGAQLRAKLAYAADNRVWHNVAAGAVVASAAYVNWRFETFLIAVVASRAIADASSALRAVGPCGADCPLVWVSRPR